MVERVRVGVISTSWYADSLHLPSLKSHPQAEVAALCGRNAERAHELARKFAIPHVYADYREMLEKGDLDAVVVAAPDDLHYTMTMDALEAGLHVLCEKPLALTAAAAATMATRADAAGVKHMVFFTFRWLQHTSYVHELLAAGVVGRTYASHISYVHGGGRGAVASWRFDGARSNGILGDLGSHLIDLARWFHGEIKSVSASVKSFGERRGAAGEWVMPTNDAATLLVEYAGGAQGVIHTSAMAHVGRRGLEQHIVIHGADGSLEADFTFGNFGGAGEAMAVRAIDVGSDEFVPLPIPPHIWEGVDPQTPMEVFNRQSAGDRYFIDAILNDLPIAPDFHDGAAVAAVVDAALESQRTGLRVEVGREVDAK